jgi:hypothetical protein
LRARVGSLGGDLALEVSNHETHRAMAEAAGLPLVHVPVTPETKQDPERCLLELVDEYDRDLVVLARYMQVLSDDLCRSLEGSAINIRRHSFLPGFKGARPYHQAYDRGVSWWAPPPTTSPPTLTRDQSSSRRSSMVVDGFVWKTRPCDVEPPGIFSGPRSRTVVSKGPSAEL